MNLETITFSYGALVNENHQDGWLPYLMVNGHIETSSWSSRGLGLDEAKAEAKVMAEERAERYCGDYDKVFVDLGEVKKSEWRPYRSCL